MPESDTGRLTVKFGMSANPDALQAVSEIAAQIANPGMTTVLFFCSPAYDLAALGPALGDAFHCDVAGCTTAGEILSSAGYLDNTLIALSLTSPELEQTTLFIDDLTVFTDQREPAALESLQLDPQRRAFALFLVDGLSMLEERAVSAIHKRFRTLPIIGGSAGDGLDFHATWVYHKGAFHRNAAVLCLFQTTLPFVPFKIQHFEATSEKLVITEADVPTRTVSEINGMPAAEEYARAVGLTLHELSPMVFAAHPVMLRIAGDYYVRSVQKVNPDGSLTFFCAIDNGLVLTVARPRDLLQTLEVELARIREEIPNLKLVFGCDCILRRLEMKQRGELDRARQILAGYHFFGFSTYGEQVFWDPRQPHSHRSRARRLMMSDPAEGLQKQLAALRKINSVLMARVERVVDSSGDSYALFEQNSLLQQVVEARTRELLDRNRQLAATLESLHESENQLTATLRSIGDGVISTDAAGIITGLNPVAESLCGWSMASACGLPVAEVLRFIDPQSRVAVPSPVDQVLRDGLPAAHPREVLLLTRGGAELHIAQNCSPIRGDEGEPRGAVLVFRDVTEEYQQREALRASEELLDRTGRVAGIGGWQYDVATRNLTWTAQTHRIHEVPPGYKPNLEDAVLFYPGEARTQIVAAFQKCIGEGVAWDVELPFITAMGRHIYVRASGQAQLENGLIIRLLGAFQDITERWQVQEQLRKLSLAVEQSPESIIITNLDSRIEYVNETFLRNTGYTREEAMGKTPAMLRSSRTPRSTFDDLWAAISRGEIWQGEFINCRKNGDEHVESAIIAPIRDPSGQVTHYLGIEQDITERKQAEQQLRETNLRLQEATEEANRMAAQANAANIAKTEFLANMSHEIRTPMNGVIGMVGLLLDSPLTEEQRHFADVVRASGESLLALINDILDYSKIEAGKLELESLDFDLYALLDDFAAAHAVRAQEKGLELICSANPDVPALLRGDSGRLRQVLNNLVGNAIKFTPEGEVAVRASVVSISADDALLRFTITDTGIGIPEHKLGLLFQKFSQVDASTTRKFGGTGLGLAISKQFCELMGGGVTVASEFGRGSEFTVTVRLGLQQSGAQQVAIPTPELRDVRVLVVDDSATNREILSGRLSAWLMRPTVAADGPSALRALYQSLETDSPFQVAIIDMQMPGMDGESLGRVIQSDGRFSALRPILLTSVGSQAPARYYQGLGFSAALRKPVSQTDLLAALRAAINPKPQHVGAAPAAADPVPVPLHPARILLAEDNITNQQVALGMLKKLGFRADPVSNGLEALRALESRPYDLVLMDVQMPEMDGFEATRAIRNPSSRVPNHQIPIISLTAHAMQGDRELCLEVGANDYVSKPLNPQALAAALARWLPVRPDAAPPFDLNALIERMLGERDLAFSVIDAFLEDAPNQLQRLRGCLEQDDLPGVKRQLHALRGAAANIAADPLRTLLEDLEAACVTDGLAAVRTKLAEFYVCFGKLTDTLTALAAAEALENGS